MEEKINEGLTTIFREVFSEPKLTITNEMSSKDVDKWDSLAHLIMLKEVEAHFQITFKIREMAGIQNVGDLIKIIESKLNDNQ